MNAESMRIGAWSDPVAGLRGRLFASCDGTFAGTPDARIDLELQNVSEVDGPLWLLWDVDRALSFVLHDESGSIVESACLPCSIMRVTPFWLALPYDSTLRMNITTRGYGRRPNRRSFIGLPGNGAWEIAPGDDRRFFLSGTLSMTKSEEPIHRAWEGILDLPSVEAIIPRQATSG